MALSHKTGLYIAREVVPGTPATTPITGVPCKMTFTEKPEHSYPEEDRVVRAKDVTRVPGVVKVDWDLKGAWYNDSMGYFVSMLLGLPVSSSDVHTFKLLDVPEASTLWKRLDTDTVLVTGARAQEVKWSFEAGNKPIEFEAKGMAMSCTFGQAAPTQTFDVGKPFAGWLPTVKVAGTAATDVKTFEVTLTAPIEELFTSGNQTASRLDVGKLEVKGKMKLDFDSEAALNAFHSNTDQSLEFTATSGTNILDVLMTVVTYDSFKFDYEKAALGVEVDFVARLDTSVNTPVTVTLHNSTTGYTS